MALAHTDDPPVPTSAHLRAADFQDVRQVATVFQKAVEHHLPAGARDAVGLARRQPDQDRRQHRVAPVSDCRDFHDRPAMPLHHQISGEIAERLLLFQLLRGYFSLNHDFRFSGNFERHRFTSHELHRPVSDRARNSQLVQAIREIGRRHIVDVGERTQNDRHGQRLAAALRVGIMIEHGVMRRTDSGEQTIRRSKVAAVHSHVADAGLGIARNKWTCDTRIAAKSRFLNRRRKHR